MDSIFQFLSTPFGFSLFLVFSFFLTMYIIGYTKSQKDKIVILNGKKDYYILVIILTITVFTAFISREESKIEFYYLGVFLLLILSSYNIYLTYIANVGHPNRIFIAVCSKIFIISIILLIFLIRFLELMIADDKKNQDRRFKDGTRGNLIIAADERTKRFTDRFIKDLIK
jgi:isoprenylcysteine carboxyl methyltransferase (ICMT) family protein YpbQ